ADVGLRAGGAGARALRARPADLAAALRALRGRRRQSGRGDVGRRGDPPHPARLGRAGPGATLAQRSASRSEAATCEVARLPVSMSFPIGMKPWIIPPQLM